MKCTKRVCTILAVAALAFLASPSSSWAAGTSTSASTSSAATAVLAADLALLLFAVVAFAVCLVSGVTDGWYPVLGFLAVLMMLLVIVFCFILVGAASSRLGV